MPHLEPVHDGPDGGGPTELVIVGCSAEKADTDVPLPALDLYNGGCIPALRARIGHHAHKQSQVRFLSAEHGLVTANTRLHTYDRPLDPVRAGQLRPHVWRELQADFHRNSTPERILVIAEPLYLVLLADLLAEPGRPRIFWIPDHAHGWPQATAILDDWGW